METQKPTKFGLTDRQREYLDWVKAYIEENDGKSPSYAQIADAMGTNISTAQGVIKHVIKRGHLVNMKGSKNSLAVVD